MFHGMIVYTKCTRGFLTKTRLTTYKLKYLYRDV